MSHAGDTPCLEAHALLSVHDLAIAYRDGTGAERRAVDGVSLTLRLGETLGIVGESGSGKSTLARALLGYGRAGSRFVSGQVRLAAREGAGGIDRAGEIDLLDADARLLQQVRGRDIAFVPQNPLQALTPHMTIGAQIGEALARQRGLGGAARTEAAMALLRAMQIAEPGPLLARYPHEISGGQRQRVVLAAAMAGSPRLLVLDEPTTALDKSTEAQIVALLRDLRARTGCALVVVSHDLRLIHSLCDRVLVMLGGKSVEEGPAEAILSAPREEYTRRLVGALPHLVARPARPRGEDALLRIEALGFSYGRRGVLRFGRPAPVRPALADVSLALRRGETLGIVGESGSGKSTLGGLVAGLLAGHSGSMTFDGAPLGGAARHRVADQRRRIQMVFQDPSASLNPRHSVGAIVARGFEVFEKLGAAQAWRRAEALFERIGLAPYLMGRLPGELSGGQQQRVAVARAFAARPDLVICDEITSALDVTVQAQVLDLMRDLQARDGVAYLFISHDLAVVSEMADDIAVLRQGALVAQGAAGSIIARPPDAYTKALVAAFADRGAPEPPPLPSAAAA